MRAWVPLGSFRFLQGPRGGRSAPWRGSRTCCICCRLAPEERGALEHPLPGTEPRVGVELPLGGLFFGPCRSPCEDKPRTAVAPGSGHLSPAVRGAAAASRPAGSRTQRPLPAPPRRGAPLVLLARWRLPDLHSGRGGCLFLIGQRACRSPCCPAPT